MVNTNNTKSVRKVRKAKARRKLSSRELKKERDRFLNSNIGQTVIPLNKSAEYSAQYAFQVLYDSPEAVGLPENLKWFHDNEGKSDKIFPVIVTKCEFHGVEHTSLETVIEYIRFPHPKTKNGVGGRQGLSAVKISSLSPFNIDCTSNTWSSNEVNMYLKQLKSTHRQIFQNDALHNNNVLYNSIKLFLNKILVSSKLYKTQISNEQSLAQSILSLYNERIGDEPSWIDSIKHTIMETLQPGDKISFYYKGALRESIILKINDPRKPRNFDEGVLVLDDQSIKLAPRHPVARTGRLQEGKLVKNHRIFRPINRFLLSLGKTSSSYEDEAEFNFNELKSETLLPGDVIGYYDPMGVAGIKSNWRESTVIYINPDAVDGERKLGFDDPYLTLNKDLVPVKIVKRIGDNGSLQPYSCDPRPLSSYTLTTRTNDNAFNDAIKRSSSSFKALRKSIIASAEEKLMKTSTPHEKESD